MVEIKKKKGKKSKHQGIQTCYCETKQNKKWEENAWKHLLEVQLKKKNNIKPPEEKQTGKNQQPNTKKPQEAFTCFYPLMAYHYGWH